MLIANAGALGGGIAAFGRATPEDGKLDVAVITADGALQWMRTLTRARVGHAEKSPLVQMTQATRIQGQHTPSHGPPDDLHCRSSGRRQHAPGRFDSDSCSDASQVNSCSSEHTFEGTKVVLHVDYVSFAVCAESKVTGAGPVVGSGAAWAVFLVGDITDGIVHVQPRRGPVSTNVHLLDGPPRHPAERRSDFKMM